MAIRGEMGKGGIQALPFEDTVSDLGLTKLKE